MTVRRKVSPAQAAVRKASKPESTWVALYDENGKLLGICDPANITPVANGGSLSPMAKQAARAPRPAPKPDAMAKAERAAELRKGLNAPRMAAENDAFALELNRAAITGLDIIHGRQPRSHG